MATTGRDSGRSSVKELYPTKAKCVVDPDFTLDHYNVTDSGGNFDSDERAAYANSSDFTGASNHVTITNSELDWTPGTDARTWSFWFTDKISTCQTTSPGFTHGQAEYEVGGVNKFTIYTSYGAGRYFSWASLDESRGVTGGTSYVDDEWHHIVVIIDPVTDELNHYVDGEAHPWPDAITNTNTFTGALVLGYETDAGYGGNSTYHSDACLSSFSYWTRAFSAAEVAELYNSGKLFDLGNHSAATDLKLWWKMGGAEPFTDLSGNGYTGTNVGTSLKPTAPTFDSKPYQLPFSKRFQVVRALDGNQVTKG